MKNRCKYSTMAHRNQLINKANVVTRQKRYNYSALISKYPTNHFHRKDYQNVLLLFNDTLRFFSDILVPCGSGREEKEGSDRTDTDGGTGRNGRTDGLHSVLAAYHIAHTACAWLESLQPKTSHLFAFFCFFFIDRLFLLLDTQANHSENDHLLSW